MKNMKSYFEVTKYNPIFRNECGFFVLKNEWTDYSCIGKSDEDGVLTREKYLEFENKYINAIKLYIDLYKFKEFSFSSIEAYSNKNDFLELDKYLYDFYLKFKRKKYSIVDINDVEKLTQLILRSYIWGKYVFTENEYEIGFGSDYYMDFLVGDSSNIDKLKSNIINLGLYIGRTPEENIVCK